jgi:hypothetical protein
MPPKSSTRRWLRWPVLVLSSVAMTGAYYCFDNPSALHEQMKAAFEETSYAPNFEFYFNLLYTVIIFIMMIASIP